MSARLRALAADTLAVLDAGGYVDGQGRTVPLAEPVRAAVAGTRLHLPDEPLPAPAPRGGTPKVEVTGESTLAAARRLAADGAVAALVFASAKNPGGGFRTGAQAQEESVARASALYPCLTAVPEFYAYHREQRDLLYSDRVIHSPRVPVFRDDRGRLLDAVHEVSFLIAAAPNRGALLRQQPADADRVAPALRTRARRVLAVAAAHGHRRLVLGAWGCGVFRNDPGTVADAFATALADAPGWFDQVTFAVLDRADGPTYAAFARRLLPG
ncbi:TIGR02452 family protein [Micromonospora halotolerans]|uniref:TIGR02452 family protein n=1 Tax=Micromonospora halotolerans TaxID=709879 RepID=A0ABY9ZUD4_9ACTN|nr:TIGR02452 family protein [Micromonospora halotolerans]WNM38517.1 TIGR02452 family protein [Micromonospora halotolerans]